MSKRTILVVDDEPAIRDSICELLEVEGYQSRCATNGQEALQSLGSEPDLPDLILLDQMMPKMTGSEFLAHVKAIPEYSAIPVVLVSAASNGAAIAQQFGVLFVRKPLDADLLLKAIERSI